MSHRRDRRDDASPRTRAATASTLPTPRRRRPWRARTTVVLLSGGLGLVGPGLGLGPGVRAATAQSATSPVYVDDSTRAHDLLRRAIEQAEDNAGEAIRQLQQLLDDFGPRLVPATELDRDVFTSVRRRVLDVLRSDPELLQRHRLVETAAAQRLLAAGDLERLVATRPLTAPGLEARLRLGQSALESARFVEAIDQLEEAVAHPDATAETSAAAWSMLGLAAHYAAGRPDAEPDAVAWYRQRRDAAIDALATLGLAGASPRAELEALVRADEGARLTIGSGPFDRARSIDFQGTVGEVIWSVDPDRPEPLLEDATRGLRRGADTNRARAAAAITEDAVFIADGLRVTAIDRFTARPLWTDPYVEASSSELLRDDVIGIRPVAIAGDALVTIVGAASTDQASTNNSAYVVRLDASTGRRVWRRALRRLGGVEEFEGLFPHGRPWIAEGRVHVLARRLTPERLLSCYVVALDLETGEPHWIRHVASIGARMVDKPVTSLLLDRGELFIATPVGATACLDAATGEFKWLVRSDVPTNLLLSSSQQPYEIDAPVVLEDRVVSIRPDRAAVEVRSRDDGRLEASVPIGITTPWGEPDYLLTDGRRIFAVADDVRCFTLELLEVPLWRAPPDPAEALTPMSRLPEGLAAQAGQEGGEPAGRDAGQPGREPGVVADPGLALELDATASRIVDEYEVAGRVLVAGENLLVPSDVGLLVIDRETGVEGDQLEIGPGGSPAASGAQLVLAGPDRSLSWMSLEEAESLLRLRIAALPDEPGPRLSLLRLAVRIGRVDLVLDAARFTIEAIRAMEGTASDAPRRELFETLIAVDTDRLLGSEDDARRFFAVLDSIVEDEDERIAARMAEGDWLAPRNPPAAITAWQAILADPALATRARTQGDRFRPARAWVIDRVGALLEAGGPAVQADVDAMSWAALAGALDGAAGAADRPLDDASTEDLQRIAVAWPFAEAGVRAGLAAADRFRADGQRRVAQTILLGLYRDLPTEERASALLGALLDTVLGADRPDEVARLADAIDARHPDVVLARSEGPALPVTAWIDGSAWRRSVTGDANPAGEVDAGAGAGAGAGAAAGAASGDGAAAGAEPSPAAAGAGTADALAASPPATETTGGPGAPGAAGAPTAPAAPAPPPAPPAPRFDVRPPPPPPPGPAPRLTGPVERIPAAIIRRVAGPDDMPTRGFRPGHGLLHDGEAVLRIDPDTGGVMWRTELVPTEIELLDAGAETILLWTGDRRGSLGMREAAAVIALEARTGRVQWTSPPADELLPPAIGGDRSNNRMPNNYAFSPDEVIVRLDGPRILMARRNGIITALDRELGDVVLWTAETGFEQLHELEPGPLGIVASGQRRRAGRPLPQQVVIDPDDGSIRTRLEEPESFAAAWLRSDGLGTVLAGSEAGIVAIDTLTGGRRWVLADYAARGTNEAWRRGRLMVLMDRTGDLRSIDPLTGRLSGPFGRGGDERDALAGRTQLVGHDRALVAFSRERLIRFAPDGQVLGADAITEIVDPRSRRDIAITPDGWIVLLAQYDRNDRNDRLRVAPAGRSSYTYRVYVLAPDGRVQDDVVQLDPIARQVTSMQVVGDTLLLGTPLETLLIPLVRQQVG